jgi:hypothetical protein
MPKPALQGLDGQHDHHSQQYQQYHRSRLLAETVAGIAVVAILEQRKCTRYPRYDRLNQRQRFCLADSRYVGCFARQLSAGFQLRQQPGRLSGQFLSFPAAQLDEPRREWNGSGL